MDINSLLTTFSSSKAESSNGKKRHQISNDENAYSAPDKSNNSSSKDTTDQRSAKVSEEATAAVIPREPFAEVTNPTTTATSQVTSRQVILNHNKAKLQKTRVTSKRW